jgi:spore coat protein H
MRSDWKKAPLRRRLESIVLYFFPVTGLIILLGSLLGKSTPVIVAQDHPAVTALASAMPDDGWAPLLVYFSAYGSHAEGATIVRIEWDLDGNGSYDFDATSTGGYASYLYSKPGDYLISLRVIDDQGRSATDQVIVSVRVRASSSVDYWSIFDDSRVRRIDISLKEADWDLMWADPMSKILVPADAVIFGETLDNVGLRMRGQFSLQNSGEKKPWVIDTNAFVDGQEFHNLHQLLLLNSIGDPTLLYEKLAYEMMAFTGLPASHTAHVELWIDLSDDEQPAIFWGVYLMVERVDNKYLSNRFGPESEGGNLYKASHAERGPMDLWYYGENITEYPVQNGQYAYGKMNNEEEADYSDIIELCRVINATYVSDEEFMQALEDVLNVDSFLRYTAVTTIINNWDTYPVTGNNYYLFNNSVSGVFEWIPWDLTWGQDATAPLIGAMQTEFSPRAPLYTRVFEIDEYVNQYAAYVDLLLRLWFNTAHITEQAQFYHHLIAPYVTQSTGDKGFYGGQSMWSLDAFTDSWEVLVTFTGERHVFLQAELDKLKP